MHAIFFLMRLQSRLIGRPSGIDPFIQSGQLDHQRCFDRWHLGGLRLTPVIGHRRGEIGIGHGQRVADATAIAETDRADLAARTVMIAQKFERGEKILHQLGAIQRPLHRPPVLVIAGIAAKR